MISKAELRKQILAGSKTFNTWQNPELLAFLKARSGVWTAYSPLKGELPAGQMVSELKHLDWVYPVVTESGLVFQKQGGPTVDPQNIAGLLIPGLAFDFEGYRLGRGKGYFDRFLKGYLGIKIGVVPEAQVFNRLPRDVWDQRMNFIATETRLIEVSQEAE